MDQNDNIPEILLVDKPKGISSFDIIRRLRKRFGRIKMGHAGTLDPLATGLMIIGIGAGTKKLHNLIGLPKIYEAHVLLGKKTDTGDLDGKVIEEKPVENLDDSQVRNIVQSMIGIHHLAVPAYSAVKQGGVPLYKKARAGQVVQAPIKPMEVQSIKLRSVDFISTEKSAVLDIEIGVTSGSYIRTLGEELGNRLGYPATLKELRRTSIGPYSLKDAIKID